MTGTYDYIVVGAGSAGCVVAARLSEDPNVKVLVLEAGGSDSNPKLRMPIAWPLVSRAPEVNWGYETEPEPQLGGRRIELPRGKVLGGSSAINGMGYKRGHPRDFDQWRQMGLDGWGYADVLPYFIRSESSWRGDSEFHNSAGPLSVRKGGAPQLLYPQFAEAAQKAGYKITDDISGPDPEGIFITELTVDKRGRRHSTARAFLYPAMQRGNLTVVTRATTKRVVIENGRAVGVEYLKDGQSVVARADREVVLSAGAYNSPQLLLLSGIGPADEIREHGIPIVADVPGVGRNLMEHASCPVIMAANGPVTFLSQLRYDRAALWALRWYMTGEGPFATNGNTAGIFVRSNPSVDRPDLQLTFNTVHRNDRAWWPWQASAQKYSFSCIVCVLHPQSRGHVTLRSANPMDKPKIHLGIFTEQADVDLAIEGIRRTREVYAQEPQKSLIARENLPGAHVQSREDLSKFVRSVAVTMQHPSGTCVMGTGTNAVLDAELKVRGVDGLRVADASVFPSQPGGNINAPAIMVGEKCADLVRGRRLPAMDVTVNV
jgi:choline dehydrogenase